MGFGQLLSYIFILNLLDNLNKVQAEAAGNFNGPSLIIAGAGSGKTRVLTYRIAYMISQGVAPESILALTFTNKAASEMRERISSVVSGGARGIWMGTFHSLFARILRSEAEHIGFTNAFTIYETADSRNLVKNIIKDLNLNDETYKPKDVFSRISKMKNDLVTPQIYSQNATLIAEDRETRRERFDEVYREYMMRCKRSNAMDFDDLLLYTNLLFRDRPEVAQKYQRQFKYVLVDEYQDTNFSQYLIIKRISELNKNICVVGDDAQSIYSFRGAKIENILRFQKDYNGAKVYKLEQNYRSTKTIVNAANSVIAKNNNQLKKNSFSAGDNGELITLLRSYTEKEEAMQVVNSMRDKIMREGAEPKDMAVLYRTNAQSRVIEDSLRAARIPYKIYGGLSFYQRKEVKDVLAYVRLVVNQHDDEALTRIINVPTRGIGGVTLQKVVSYAREKGISLWQTLATHSPEEMLIKGGAVAKLKSFGDMILMMRSKASASNAYELVSEIVSLSGILAAYKEERTPEAQSASENVEALLNSLKQAKDEAESQGEEPQGVIDWLGSVALITDMDRETENDNNKVTLMTIHSSKGLEYKNVYIVGMEEGLFPSPRTAESMDSLEEERRLFYVAITRAIKHLTISFSLSRYQWGSSSQVIPSRFIREIDKQYIDSPELLQIDRAESVVDVDNEPLWQRRTFEKKPLPVNEPRTMNPLNNSRSSVGGAPNLKRVSATRSHSDASVAEIVVGATVFHKVFGKGVVTDIEQTSNGPKATVDFILGVGTKVLLLNFAKLDVFK